MVTVGQWQCLDWQLSPQILSRILCICLNTPSPNTHTTHTHISEICPKSRTPPTHTLIGTGVPVSCYVSRQVLATCAANQALKTMDFRGADEMQPSCHGSVEAQASRRLHRESIPPWLCPGRRSPCLRLPAARRRAPQVQAVQRAVSAESLAALGRVGSHASCRPPPLTGAALSPPQTAAPWALRLEPPSTLTAPTIRPKLRLHLLPQSPSPPPQLHPSSFSTPVPFPFPSELHFFPPTPISLSVPMCTLISASIPPLLNPSFLSLLTTPSLLHNL